MPTITADNLDGFLYGRTDFEKRRLDKADQEAMGLDLVRRIMSRTGFVPPGRIFHIAGTNGKGSVCFYLEQALLARGERTGTFLSPHAVRLGERFRIAGEEASPESIVRAADTLQQAAGPLLEGATTFEVLFLIGAILFHEAGVTVSILETGLGGRLDTTNVVAPDAVLITPIALDHTAILGTTITAIAREKAGIIKTGVPCFTGAQKPAARAVLAETAAALQAPFHDATAVEHAWTGLGLAGGEYRCGDRKLSLRMPGRHQGDNLHLALQCLDTLGLSPPAGPFAARLAAESLPARMEYFPGTPDVLLDGGHNPAAAAVLRDLLAETGKKVHALVGIQADKDSRSFIRTMEDVVTRFTFTESGSSRTAAPAALAAGSGVTGSVIDNPQAALTAALQATPANGLLVIAGSFYLAGLLRGILTARANP